MTDDSLKFEPTEAEADLFGAGTCVIRPQFYITDPAVRHCWRCGRRLAPRESSACEDVKACAARCVRAVQRWKCWFFVCLGGWMMAMATAVIMALARR